MRDAGARLAHTLNWPGTKPAKKLSAGVKSPYFGMKDFAFAYA